MRTLPSCGRVVPTRILRSLPGMSKLVSENLGEVEWQVRRCSVRVLAIQRLELEAREVERRTQAPNSCVI